MPRIQQIIEKDFALLGITEDGKMYYSNLNNGADYPEAFELAVLFLELQAAAGNDAIPGVLFPLDYQKSLHDLAVNRIFEKLKNIRIAEAALGKAA